jgi:hypothetical protein
MVPFVSVKDVFDAIAFTIPKRVLSVLYRWSPTASSEEKRVLVPVTVVEAMEIVPVLRTVTVMVPVFVEVVEMVPVRVLPREAFIVTPGKRMTEEDELTTDS